MKNLLLVNREKIFVTVLCLFCLSFSFGVAANNVMFITLIGITLLYFSLKTIRNNIYYSLITLLFGSYFLINLLSLIYSSNIEYGLKLVFRLSPFLIFPIVIYNFSDLFNRKLINKALNYFVLGVVLSLLVCLLYNGYRSYIWGAFNPLNESNGNFFSYFNLTELLDIHPIYYGCYTLLSISYLLIRLIFDRSIDLIKQILFSLLVLFLIVNTILLNSFMLIIILGLLIIGFGIYCLINKIGIKFIIGIVLLSTYPTYKASYFLQEKFKGIDISNDFNTTDYSGDNFTAIKARKAKASLSIKLIRENVLFGTGIGDSKQKLQKTYLENGFEHGVKNNFNSHNQYLTTFIALGVIGFAILILSVIIMYYEAILFKNPYLFCFVVIVSFFMLTESILERQVGVMFFSFFSILLSYNYMKLNNEK